MRRRSVMIGVLAVSLLVGGCGSTELSRQGEKEAKASEGVATGNGGSVEGSAEGEGGARWTTRETNGGTYRVSYRAVPSPIPLNAIFGLEVKVFKDAGMTVAAEGVMIVADAGMPAHHHGMNLTPRVQRVGPGEFRVTGMLFHMPGYWELYVDVREGGEGGAGREERARFEVEL